MIDFGRFEQLPHIILQREPEQAEVRSRRSHPPGVRPRSNRRQHADRLKEQTKKSVAELTRLREVLGVIPNRLLILRLETLDANQREVLERLDVSVVEELKEHRSGRAAYKLLVQFPDSRTLERFTFEYDRYAESESDTTEFPPKMREKLFDALNSVSTVTAKERTGPRLLREGVPMSELFYLDVDLWNPVSDEDFRDLLSDLRKFVDMRGGKIAQDPLRIPTMILLKVQANRRLLDDLLQLDQVSLVDLPPVPEPEDSFDLFQPIKIPEELQPVPVGGGLACVLDSGVVAGHPLLRGVVVAEEDFDSGEDSPVDRNGHGTQVAGIVAYGDIARRIQGNEWLPQVSLCSAKVLRNEIGPGGESNGAAIFPDEKRVEDQLKQAIEYFHNEHRCRVFNLSIGRSDAIYSGGRQLPWAELLDELARKLDIVIVISAGNVADPDLPEAKKRSLFHREVAKSLLQPSHRLIDPATAALCVTVGSIARRGDPYMRELGPARLAGSAEGCPSPFTRCGPGVAKAVKSELVAPGGNFAVSDIAGSVRWIKNDPNLGEPTLNHNFASQSPLRAVCGTSLASAQVTHIAARMEAVLRNQLNVAPSQNLIRALMASSACVPENIEMNDSDSQSDLLMTIGYGQPRVEFSWSSRNRVVLLAEDIIEHRNFHVYSLVVPEDFIEESGKRSISVSLAYDPPTRMSRQDYIATSMWIEIFGGLTTEQLIEYKSKYEGDQILPTVPDRNQLDFLPRRQQISTSTLQKRLWHSSQGTTFRNRRGPDGESTLHILVGCRQRFPNPLGEETQRYALVVTLEHESLGIDVYQKVRNRVRTQARLTSRV